MNSNRKTTFFFLLVFLSAVILALLFLSQKMRLFARNLRPPIQIRNILSWKHFSVRGNIVDNRTISHPSGVSSEELISVSEKEFCPWQYIGWDPVSYDADP